MTDEKAQQELIGYLAQVVPGAMVDCAGCPVKRPVSQAIQRDGKFYCKEECADRANAVYRKPQLKSVLVDNWEV